MQILRKTYPHAMEGSVMRANVQGNQDFCTKKSPKYKTGKNHTFSFPFVRRTLKHNQGLKKVLQFLA